MLNIFELSDPQKSLDYFSLLPSKIAMMSALEFYNQSRFKV